MDFNTYLNKSWAQHGDNSQQVADTFKTAMELIDDASHVVKFSSLIVHVMGEHLGNIHDGILLLEVLSAHIKNNDESQTAINCGIAILNSFSGVEVNFDKFSDEDQIRIYTGLVSLYLSKKLFDKSAQYFNAALISAEKLSKTDSVNKTLAVAANNLACSFEELQNLNSEENQLMLKAAHTARKYWELSGTWLEVERAEYRLAQSYLKVGDLISSIKHANLCLTICEKNNAGGLEFFFAYESIAMVEKAMKQPLRSLVKMHKYYSQLSQDDKSWCEAALKKIENT